jgi:hypothetical protein
MRAARVPTSRASKRPAAWVCAWLLLPLLPAWAEDAPSAQLLQLTQQFSGHWACGGHFSNGKLISSAESFAPILGARFLAQEHSDNAPFTYNAHALWGYDQTQHLFTLSIYDNFGGQRLFTSSGWQDAALTFETHALLAPVTRQERFIYKSLTSDAGYSVEYQVLDKSGTWKMGDVLECHHA